MSTLAGEFWVCGECRSINNAGAKQCYNCRTPKDRAAVDPETIDPSTHGKLREIELPPFRPTRGVALLATVGIVAIAIMQAYNTFIAASVIQLHIDGAEVAPNQLEFANTVGIVTLGIAALALIGWSLWLSRAVTAMPALDLGYPAADGFMAFVENFLPGLNLYRVPAIVRDVVHRLEPGTVRGEAVIFASWLALLGGVLIPRIGAAVTGTTLQSGVDALRTTMLVLIVASFLVALGAAGLVALIWWVERRIERRHEAQLAEATAPETPPTERPATTRNLIEPLATRSAFAAVGAGLTQPDAPRPAGPGPAVATPPAPGFSLPGVEVVESPDLAADDAWAQVTARRMEAASVPDAPAEPAAQVVVASPVEVAPPVELAPPVEAAPPVETPVPVETPASVETLDAQPAEPLEPIEQPEPATADAGAAGPPHLTIKVGARGMITAEVDGEVEHVILDDLSAYADALAKVDGTAAIRAATDDPMAGLIARRAQRILDDAGVQVTVD